MNKVSLVYVYAHARSLRRARTPAYRALVHRALVHRALASSRARVRVVHARSLRVCTFFKTTQMLRLRGTSHENFCRFDLGSLSFLIRL